MIKSTLKTTILQRSFAAAALLASAIVSLPAMASAGECPADKMTVNGQAPGPDKAKDVTDTVIAAIDLAKEGPKLEEHQFRLRKLVIEPGGIVSWHSHADRPAIIYIISGSITEYASTCAEPILHKAGDVARETHATQHWWKNTGSETVVLLSADILHSKTDPHTM